jgi:hypothetical protein
LRIPDDTTEDRFKARVDRRREDLVTRKYSIPVKLGGFSVVSEETYNVVKHALRRLLKPLGVRTKLGR